MLSLRHVLVAIALTALLFAPLKAADDPTPEATRQYAVAYGFQSKKLFAQAIPRWAEFLKASASTFWSRSIFIRRHLKAHFACP